MILSGVLFCKLRYKFHAEQCGQVLQLARHRAAAAVCRNSGKSVLSTQIPLFFWCLLLRDVPNLSEGSEIRTEVWYYKA